MKSRREAKKNIKKSFNGLYLDLILYEAFTVNADVETARDLTNEIIEVENELVSRVSVNEGKQVKGRVKHYFKKIDEDLHAKIAYFNQKITALP